MLGSSGSTIFSLAIPDNVRQLMKAYDVWLDRYKANLPVLVE